MSLLDPSQGGASNSSLERYPSEAACVEALKRWHDAAVAWQQRSHIDVSSLAHCEPEWVPGEPIPRQDSIGGDSE